MTEREENDIEYIEAYYSNNLSTDELAAFEERRKTDVEFAKKVMDYSNIIEGIRSEGESYFNEKIHKWENEITSQENIKMTPWKKLAGMAAALLLIAVSIGYLYFATMSAPTTDDLFTAYYEPYTDVLSERSNGDDLTQAMNAYNLEQYSKAIVHFKRYLAEHPNDNKVLCYLGIAYLSRGEYKQAEARLLQTNKNTQGLFNEVSEWYLCLTYLKLKKNNLFNKTIDKIINKPDHIFYTEAVTLKSEL